MDLIEDKLRVSLKKLNETAKSSEINKFLKEIVSRRNMLEFLKQF